MRSTIDTFAAVIIGFGVVLIVYLLFAPVDARTVRVPAELIQRCIEVEELSSNFNYYRVPVEFVTYCIEKRQ